MYDHNTAANDFFQHLMRDPSFFDPIESGSEGLDDDRPRKHEDDPHYNRFLRRPRYRKPAPPPDPPDPDGA